MAENNPHDSLVRRILSNQEVGAAALRSMLPAEVSDELDFSRLRLEDGTFVDKVLQSRQTDLLFTVPARTGADVFVYVLLEHQSSVDRKMPRRLLRYADRIWERWEKDHGEGSQLPEIIPIVLYHGQRRWTAPMTLQEMVSWGGRRPITMEPCIGLRYFLVDLTQVSEAEVIEQVKDTSLDLLLTLLHLKVTAYTTDLKAMFQRWAWIFGDIVRRPDGWSSLTVFFSYTATIHGDTDPNMIAKTLKTVVDEATGEDIMPHPNRFVEAMLQERRPQWEAQALAEAAMDLVDEKFPEQAASARPWVESATAEELKSFIRRIIKAKTLAELLGEDES